MDKDYGDGNVSSSWDKLTIFYNKHGRNLFYCPADILIFEVHQDMLE